MRSTDFLLGCFTILNFFTVAGTYFVHKYLHDYYGFAILLQIGVVALLLIAYTVLLILFKSEDEEDNEA